jgi:hypothetical protein
LHASSDRGLGRNIRDAADRRRAFAEDDVSGSTNPGLMKSQSFCREFADA